MNLRPEARARTRTVGSARRRSSARVDAIRIGSHLIGSRLAPGLLGVLLLLAVLARPSVADASPFSSPRGSAPRLRLLGPGTVAVPAPTADPAESTAPEALPAEAQPGVRATENEGDDAPRASVRLETRRVPPFYTRREFDTHTTRALYFPPVFVDRRPKGDHPEKFLHVDLSLTFGWYEKNNLRRRWFNPAGLFIGSFSKPKTQWAAIPLLMGYKRVGEQYNFGQFPLFWAWGNKYVKNFLAIPVHWQSKSPEGFRGMSGLLVWYGRKNFDDGDESNDRRHLVVFPAYLGLTRGLKKYWISPLYIGGRNDQTGLKHRSLLPFFHWESREFGNRKELWTLGWIQRKDVARRKHSWAVPLALTFDTRTPERSLFSATPLVWRGRDHLRGRETWVLGPVGRSIDPRQRNHWLAPLYFRFEDRRAHASASILAPLYFARRSPEHWEVHTVLASARRGPALAEDPERRSWGLGIHPLLTYAARRPDGRAHQLVLGGLGFWHTRRPGTEDTAPRDRYGVGPLAYYSRNAQMRHFGLLPGLTFVGHSPQRRYQVITPLFWHFRTETPEVDARTLVTGPVFYTRRGDNWRAGLPPLFVTAGGSRDRWLIVPPLLFGHVADREAGTSRTISPFVVRATAPGRRTLGVLGFGWDVRRPGEHHTAVVPLYLRRRVGDRTTLATPLGATWSTPDSRTWFVLNAYARRDPQRRGFGVAPLFWHDRRLEGHAQQGSTTGVFPLFLRDRRPDQHLDAWTPLVWRTYYGGEKPRKGLALVPFYFRQRQPGGVNVDATLGFFWSRDRDRRTHTLIAGPYFRRLTRQKLHTGVAPISWWTDSEEQRRLIALPGIVHVQDKVHGTRTTIALPLWFDRIQPDGRRVWMAFPFIVGTKGKFNRNRVGVALPGYFDFYRLTNDYRFTGYVPLLWRYQKGGFRLESDPADRYTLWGSAPLFVYGKDGKGRLTHGALVYVFDRDAEGYKLYTPVGGWQSKPGKRLMWYAGLFARDITNERATTTLFPLVWHRRHRTKRISTTWVLPPAYIGQVKQDRWWFETAGVLWVFRQQHQLSVAVAPPVFFHSYAYKQRRLHWVLPLYLRDNNTGAGEKWTWIFPGLFGSKVEKDRATAVQFPFVWHFRRDRKGRQTTLGVPMWWDFRRNGNTTQVAPLLFVGRETAPRLVDGVERPRQKLRVVGPGLGWWRHVGDGVTADLHWRVVFGLFGGGRQAGERYVALFGAKIRAGAAPVRAPRERKGKAAREAKREARVTTREEREARREAARQARFDSRRQAAAEPSTPR